MKIVWYIKPVCKAVRLKEKLNIDFEKPVGPNCSISPLSNVWNEVK